MAKKIPFKTEMAIVKRRLEASVSATADEFGISRVTVIDIMKRNDHIVQEARRRIEEQTIEAIVASELAGDLSL